MPNVSVPVLSDGRRRGDEVLPVVDLGGGLLRLLASPGLVEGLAAGDEFELAPDELSGFRVLARGGNLCVWFYFAQAVADRDPTVEDLRSVAERLGGSLDGGYARMVVLTVPLAAGFAAVARAFDGAVARHAGSRWFYGNVYDPADGETPLDWWR
jgi:hypothetical protein